MIREGCFILLLEYRKGGKEGRLYGGVAYQPGPGSWRCAHLHLVAEAPGYRRLTTEIYFPGDPHNDDDIASAVKAELVLDPQTEADGSQSVTYDFALDPERS